MRTLMVSVGGFHLGYLGCYGNEWITTPALDRLAADSIAFDNHFANVPEASTARRSWRSGRLHLPPLDSTLAPNPPCVDLLDLLREAGVHTTLVVDASRAEPGAFAQGWDEVVVVRQLQGEATFLEQTLEVVREQLAQLAQRDHWLLWVDLATLLPPWVIPAEFCDPYFQEAPTETEEGELTESDEEPEDEDEEEDEDEPEDDIEWMDEEPEEDEDEANEDEEEAEVEVDEGEPESDEEELEPLTPWFDPAPGFLDPFDEDSYLRLQGTYAAAVSFLDAGVDTLLQDLTDHGLLDRCLLVLTGDGGQALGEHDLMGAARPWLHDEQIHLPLLLRLPTELAGAGEVRGVRIQALTQSGDLMPTLLEAHGVPRPNEIQGTSLLPLARGEIEMLHEQICCGLRQAQASEWCLRTHGWSLILPQTPADDAPRELQLYVKPDDRWERNNVRQHHLDWADRLEAHLRRCVELAQQPGPLLAPGLQAEAAPIVE